MYTTIFLAVAIGVITGYLASYRGRNPYIWFCLGILFGMIGLLFLFLLPEAGEDKELSEDEIEVLEPVQLLVMDQHQKILRLKEEFLKRDWYYLDNGHKQSNALSFDDLRMFWIKGSIKDATYVWSEGMDDWMRIQEIPDLKSCLKAD
ncbi:MAG: hypothetical protein ACI9S8_001951 [Chlamydiales bacterium]|jgi:hypothetical protein